MEKRPLLIGVGIGMMVATAVLQFLSGNATTPALAQSSASPMPAEAAPHVPEPLTRDAVQQWADEQGLALLPQTEWNTNRQRLKELEGQAAKQTTTIFITPGLGSHGIEPILVKSGLLPSQNRFAAIMKERKLSTKIRSGLYTFEGPVTEETIIEEITKPR